ncbi:MAG: ATP-dependent Clp protease ATP-binding subunit [Clostridiales bacterium]|jgi:ATP-dependent Clp protease ATP-binding subunit ClpC|nr:ATP-dependent Clp protease ATP-binding subunit [Clostridiales bacterium]
MMKFPISDGVQKVLKASQEVAAKYSSGEIGTEHILYGLTATDCAACAILKEVGIHKSAMDMLFKQSFNAVSIVGQVDLTDRVRTLFFNAHKLSQTQGNGIVTPEHLLYCLLQEIGSMGHHILKDSGVDLSYISQRLNAIFGGSNNVDSIKNHTLPGQLQELGSDVTQKARDHKIDPIIGRKDEIDRIVQILCRKTKNNPVLIGEPGVGKSAVIEGLAKAIVEGNVPEILKDKIIFSLDLGSLMAGTKYRGALEEKLKNAIDIIKEQSNIIIFIDEIHTLAQAGSEKGEVAPADMLKPYLARGELQTIGATTLDEYRKYIEADKALERRFQPVMIEPPSAEHTIDILRGLRENYEAFHKVKLSDEAIVAAVNLSDRYIADRFLPDKAIDLIDEAMSAAKVSSTVAPPDIKQLTEKIKEYEEKKREALSHDDYEAAAKFRDILKQTTDKINEIRLAWSKENEKQSTQISAENIASIVAKWTKIPVQKLTESDKERLSLLEKYLQNRVIGQDNACTAVAKAVRRARAGLKDPNRPIGSFMFLGPTGVGKTELTKALSEALFDSENNIIRLDMSEYMESHSISKLIGSPPGYVGFGDGGQLTEQVRRKPYSVVLFDEIEKAHPDIYNSLLQIMDDGQLTDAAGRKVSFKNTIVILTSNAGADELKNTAKTIGFGASSGEVDQKKTAEILTNALKKRFKPEFVNRIDVVAIFNHLTKTDVEKVAHLMLRKVQIKLNEKNMTLKTTRQCLDWLVSNGYDPEYGARPLRRLIEQTIEDSIAEELLFGRLNEGSTVIVDIVNGKVVFK